MWGMWIIFIPYYHIAFFKFEKKLVVSILLAFIFAPISYYSGVKQGALLVSQIWNLAAVGTLWALFFPISIKLYKWTANESN
jgi:hypothetical protein